MAGSLDCLPPFLAATGISESAIGTAVNVMVLDPFASVMGVTVARGVDVVDAFLGMATMVHLHNVNVAPFHRWPSWSTCGTPGGSLVGPVPRCELVSTAPDHAPDQGKPLVAGWYLRVAVRTRMKLALGWAAQDSGTLTLTIQGMERKMAKAIRNQDRYGVYVRISEDRPGIETSTRTQEKESREFGDRNSWQYVDTFSDVGISAYKGKRRPGLESAIRAIETGQIDILLVWKLDRLVRSITAFHAIDERVRKAGGRIASVTDTFLNGIDKTANQIMAGLVAGFGQMESEIKSDRIKSWQRDQIGLGHHNGGTRAYGYAIKNGSLVQVKREAELLREAAKRILNGGTLRGTLRELAPMSPRSTDEKPIPMTHRGLRSALTNPTVAGLRRDGNGGYVAGKWDAIINRQDWDALNAMFSDPTRRTGTTNQNVHPLSGILTCDLCGKGVGIRKWKANPTKRNPYVQESHRYTCQCGNSIDAASAESVVMSRMWEIVTPSQWAEWKSAGTGWDPVVIDAIRARREKALMANVQGKISDAAFDDIDAECNRQEAIATGEQPLDLPDVNDIHGSWESLPVTDQRKVISQAFTTVKLNASNGCRNPEVRIATA